MAYRLNLPPLDGLDNKAGASWSLVHLLCCRIETMLLNPIQSTCWPISFPLLFGTPYYKLLVIIKGTQSR